MHNDLHIYSKDTHSLNLNNSGTLNEQNLQFAKRTVLFDALRLYSNELVKYKQGYPQDDISDVELTVDFVILSPSRYRDLIESERFKQSHDVCSQDPQLEVKPKIQP